MTSRPALAALALLGVAVVCASSPTARGQDQKDATESEQSDPVLGKRSAISFDGATPETIRLRPGTRLHAHPEPDAPVLTTVRAELELEVLDRSEEWAQVRHNSLRGWVLADPRGRSTGKSLLDRPGWLIESDETGRRRFVEAPVFSPQLTAARLIRLREFLGERERRVPFGPYELYTDVANDPLIEELESTAAVLEATYRERFGLELREADPQAVVLFAREETYRAYEREVPEISALATLGHQSHGVAVTFVGSRSVRQIRRILLHELTHLLNRRALPLVLPTWLEEGLAEDLSFSRVDKRGRIQPGTVLGVSERSLRGSRISGGFASLATLLRHYRQPTWPRVTTLVDADWEEMVQPGARPTYYTQAAFFIRFLIDGEKGRLAEGFRSYLRELAEGRPDRIDLWTSLGVEREQVEKAYDVWILQRGRAFGLTPGR